MYPYFRAVKWAIQARRKPIITEPDTVSKVQCRVWFSDIDFYPELNNGRHLTLMDLGRYCHGIQMGLFKLLRENNWGLMVAGNFTRYRRRLTFLQKFTLETEIIGYDERWFYFYQKTVRNNQIHSSALIRTALTSKEGLVPCKPVVQQLGFTYAPHVPEWVNDWIELHKVSPQI